MSRVGLEGAAKVGVSAMKRFIGAFRNAAALMSTVAIIAFHSFDQSNAAPLAFDFSGSTTTSVTITGTAGGTMSFTLDLGPTDVAGNFNIDIFNGSSAALASLYMAGLTGPTFGGVTANDYGNVTGRTDLQSEPLWNNAAWQVTIISGQLPVTLSIASVLTPLFDGDPLFSPVLTLDLSGDLQIAAAAVPSPIVGAGFPGLLAACSGLIFLTRRRRQLNA